MLGFDQKPPAACLRVRAALEENGCRHEVETGIGSIARALAASKTAGNFLCLGGGAGEVGTWVLDGMDHSSGLVALVQDSEEAAVLERELDRDLRASVHLQEAAPFLIDVNAHRFDLIVDLITEEHPQVVRLGLGLLKPGGIYLASHIGNSLHGAFTPCEPESKERRATIDPDEFAVAPPRDDRTALIVVRRTRTLKPKRRQKPETR